MVQSQLYLHEPHHDMFDRSQSGFVYHSYEIHLPTSDLLQMHAVKYDELPIQIQSVSYTIHTLF